MVVEALGGERVDFRRAQAGSGARDSARLPAVTALVLSTLGVVLSALLAFGFFSHDLLPRRWGTFVAVHDLDLWALTVGAFSVFAAVPGTLAGFFAMREAAQRRAGVRMERAALVLGLLGLGVTAASFLGDAYLARAWPF